MRHKILLSLAIYFGVVIADANAQQALSVKVLEEHPHDTRAFTQGLYWQQGLLYESSGLYGRSFIHRYRADTNLVEKTRRIDRNIFAEGVTIFQQQLFMLSWKAGIAFVFDPDSFQLIHRFSYQGEGWGLTHNDTHLIMSNGSDTLYFRDPKDFSVSRTIQVHNHWRKYHKLNELEYAESAIWANIWQSPNIIKISPENGKVLGQASLSDLVNKNSKIKGHTVLNGIAYDNDKKAFWVTGKLWKHRYLVRFE